MNRKILALSCLAALAQSGTVLAFCRTTSCEFGDTNMTCPRDGDDCVIQGEFTYWPDPCLRYAVQLDGSPRLGIDADEVQAMVAEAFDTWKQVECPGGGHPSFETVFQGFVACNEQQAVCAAYDENVNTIMFQDETWTAGEENAAGLTTPLGSTISGFLIDADVEFNSAFFEETGMMMSQLDLRRVMAHEIGHFLGLAHSKAPGALMSTYYYQISMDEVITADDIEGICAIYPPSAEPLVCETSSPAYDECSTSAITSSCKLSPTAGDPPEEEGGCQLSAGPEEGGFSVWISAAVLAAFAWARRSQARRRAGV